MPANSVGEQRWTHTSYNSAGDKVYSRTGEVVEASNDYENWTKAELEAELEYRGLPKSGNKAELVERLQEDDA